MERRIAVWIMTPRTLTCEDLLAERLFSSQLIQRLRRRQCRAASDCYQPRRCDQQDDTQKMFLRVRQGYCNDSSATLATSLLVCSRNCCHDLVHRLTRCVYYRRVIIAEDRERQSAPTFRGQVATQRMYFR